MKQLSGKQGLLIGSVIVAAALGPREASAAPQPAPPPTAREATPQTTQRAKGSEPVAPAAPMAATDAERAAPTATSPLDAADAERAAPTATSPLDAADAAMSRIDYEAARQLAGQAIAAGGLSRGELTRAYRIRALASAQLGRVADAEGAFVRLLALAPEVQVDRRLSPRRRIPLLQARGFWALNRGRFGAELVVDEARRRIIVRTTDVLEWMDSVVLWRRTDARGDYVREQRPAAREVVFDLASARDASVHAYAEVLDAQGNVLLQLGDRQLPHHLPSARRSSRSAPESQAPSYLGALMASARVNGYLAVDARSTRTDVVTFDVKHAALYFRATLLPSVNVEAGVEVEHLGDRNASWYAPHAFVDITPKRWLGFRIGLFPAPVGVYNVQLHPDFRRTTGHDALFAREVIPVLWSEVGVQVYGSVALRSDTNLSYALFLSNGLEQTGEAVARDEPAEPSLRAMRFNGLESFNSSKALGGRLGLQHREFEWGVSGYTGRYAIAARHYVTILDVDFAYQKDAVTLRAEGALSLQPTTLRSIRRRGAYALAAWRLLSYLEPYLQYDFARVQSWRQRLLLGAAWYPFPHAKATRTLRLKTEAGLEFRSSARADPVALLQLTTGF